MSRDKQDETGILRIPPCVGSRLDREGAARLIGGQQARGFEAIGDLQALTRLVEVSFDRVVRDLKFAADLLRCQMIADQPKAFPFAGRKLLDESPGLVHTPNVVLPSVSSSG